MMIRVTGGSGSGKSAFAENCVVSLDSEKKSISPPCILMTGKAVKE